MSKTRLLLVASLALTSACTDQPFEAAPPAAPAFSDGRAETVSVLWYGADGSDKNDDTQAFKSAIAAGHNVHVPSGTYYVSETISVPSHTRIYGDGSGVSVIHQLRTAGPSPSSNVADRAIIFYAKGGNAGHVVNITVESLGFVGESSAYQFALRAETARTVVFQNNRGTNIGLVDVANHRDASTLTSEDQLSSDVKVLGNTGTGPAFAHAGLHGIEMGYTKDGTISGNTVENYEIGIMLWGGEADPAKAYYSHYRWTQNFLVENNTVNGTYGGIVAIRSDSIRVFKNTLRDCRDVCLDAEGSRDVMFNENNARNAGGAVLSAFFAAEEIRFAWNEVHQDGRYAPGPTGAYVTWDRLFKQEGSYGAVGENRIYIHNNWFYYDATTGVGTVTKESTRYFQFANNTLRDVVLSLNPLDGGHAEVSGNGLTFTRSTGSRSGIEVGSTHSSTGELFDLYVGGNTVDSQVGQSSDVAGIKVRQYTSSGEIFNHVHNNTIKGFPKSTWIFNDGFAHRYRIEGNQHTGTIDTITGYTWPVVEYVNNTQI